jgi:glyoxylase-like metal-dependent hydrolase (beta-lactamase superfamily II)
MRRGILVVALLAAGAMSMTIAGFQQPPAGGQPQGPKVVEVEKLKDNLYILKGGGGNTAVFVRSDGIVVVDTKLPGWGQPILDKIKTISDKPITTVINTHTHGDHVSGNVEFPANIEIITQENTKANMEQMRPAASIPQQGPPTNIFKEHGGKGMPTKTFKDKMTLGKGADEVELFYFGRGHTNGDAWVVFPALRVMHAGDIFSGKNIPLLDSNNGGSGVAIPDTLAKAANSAKNIDVIITGHSTQMTVADLKEYSEFNRDFLAAVREAKKAGKSVDDVANSWKIPEKYKGYAAPQPVRLKSNVQAVFDELK